MTQAISTLPAGRIELRAPGMTKMQQIARRMWLPMFAMGAMVLLAALVIGVVQSSFASDLFDLDKGARDTVTGSLLDKQQFIETTNIWLPRFQLLGIGLMFGGITFLLATILGNRVSTADWSRSVQAARCRPLSRPGRHSCSRC